MSAPSALAVEKEKLCGRKIAATDSSDDSDNNSEENEKLREADVGRINDFLPGSKIDSKDQKFKERVKSLQKSRRQIDDSKDKEENLLNTTPEFRNFVGKKLSDFLDSCIEDVEELKSEIPDKVTSNTDSDGTFKFFRCSKGKVTTESEEEKEIVRKRPIINLDASDSNSDSSENERISEAAVSHETIFPSHTKNKDKHSGSGSDSNYSELNHSHKTKKHKKNKKKKKFKSDDAKGD